MADSKKYFLFVSVPMHGHMNPLMAPAKVLLQQGHKVQFACFEEMKAKFQTAGIPFLSLGPDHLQLGQHGDACLDPFKTVEEQSQVAVKMFFGWEVAMYPALMRVVQEADGRPDVIVADIVTMAAVGVAEQLQLPLALLGSLPIGMCLESLGLSQYNAARHIPHQSFGGKVFAAKMSLFEKYWQNPRAKRSSMLQMQPLIDARIASRKELGLPPLEEEIWAPMQVPAGVPRHTVLVASSWTMEIKREVPANWHLTGAMGVDFSVNYPPSLEDGDIKRFLEEGAAAGQFAVLVALGTIVVLKQQQVAQMAAAFASMPSVRFVWSLKEVCHAMLPAGYTPPNVLISSWVPQPAVLGHPAVKAFVSHGGQNSTNEGLTAGKPILCMPFGADQPINAQLIADRGFGLKADPTKLTSKGLVASITKLLTEPRFAAAAAAAGRELRSRSGPQDTADLLLQFAAAEPAAAVREEPVQPAAAAAAGVDVLQEDQDAVCAKSAGPRHLRLVDSASDVAAAGGDDVSAGKDAAAKGAVGAAAAAAAGKEVAHTLNEAYAQTVTV
uniref:Glycosyltransferase n=1 Tax=Tetradesmus obliquus TaxID=3088 RepID=A0A383VEK4_TETOB|eukprot:jgi/Sobl393_1/8442/SZX63383.1